MTNQCEHGSLARVCRICELEAENRELRDTIATQAECIKANAEERQDWQRELIAAKSDFAALRRELQTWKDALWQACGDDEATVNAYVDSQRAARPGEKK